MSYELHEIKRIRKSLGLTQTELAKKANVSQSLIAKIEAGTIDPTFTKTQKIFETLDMLQKKEETKAEEVMIKKLIAASPEEDIKNVIKKMKKYDISQMPVVRDQQAVGMISESILLDALLEDKGKIVGDIMEDAPPIVAKQASLQVVSSLLQHYPMVVVSDAGKLIGSITKTDILSTLYKS